MQDRTVIQLGSVRPGARLNGMYEIEALLAQGGMGEVYKGFNIQTHDPVAIKMLLPELAHDADAFALFRREASTLHNLHHEAIVRYFGFSVDPDLQRAYLAMEFVDGPSLAKTLARGPLPLADVTILRKRIAGALDAAHRFGVVHRDISSDNIILPGNDPRRAKIIDFGIAQSHRPGEGTLIGGGFAGKYNYVAPEQLGLAGGEVTAKSDIYSLGLVLAEALRGRPIDMNGTQLEIIEKRRSVPDLSALEPSVRPLIQAMLQPLPADRPESMAQVAAWGASADAGRRKSADRPEGGRSVGRLAAVLGVLILIGSIGGTLYAFRDELPWSKGAPGDSPQTAAQPPEIVATTASAPVAPLRAAGQKPPPLPDLPGQIDPTKPAPADSPQTPPPEAATPSPPTKPHVPTADEIVQSMQPSGTQGNASAEVHRPPAGPSPPGPILPPLASVPSAPVQPSAPPAVQPSVAPAAPPVTASTQASAAAAAPPSAAPSPAVVASIQPPAAPAAQPRAPQASIAIDDAVVGAEYESDLPPFSDSADSKTLALHAEPGLPEGLSFADLGSGFGKVFGVPSKPGQYAFDILAKNPAGRTARMAARITISPAPTAVPAIPEAPPTSAAGEAAAPAVPAPSPDLHVASLQPAEKAAAFLQRFDGGACFLARPLGGGSDSVAIQGIGSDRATFERLYGDFIRETGIEPVLTVRLIGPAECPAVDLIRAMGSDRGQAPKIDLAGYEVGRAKPLMGTIANLAGRHLDLLLLSNDGKVTRLDTRVQPGGGAATFSAPIVPDAASVGPLQLLIAIAASRPPPTLVGFKSGAAKDVLPPLQDELPAVAGALEVEYFKFAK